MLTSESNADQAAGLRWMQQRPVRVVAVTGGKGGVGKTSVAVNLAVALALEGREVMLLDGDMGLANVDVLLGLHPTSNLSHVIKGERTLDEVIVVGPAGIRVVPAASGLQEMANLGPAQHAGLINAFSGLSTNIDTLVIDTAAGISVNVTSYSRAAQEVLVVLCDEPAAITDSYALIKLLSKDYGVTRFRVIANMVNSAQEAKSLFNKLLRVTDKYLDVALDFIGTIPQDEYLKRAVQRQRTVIEAYPRSKSAIAFRKLAQKTISLPMPTSAQGHLEFFVERLICASQVSGGE